MEASAAGLEQECYAINTACYREIPKIQGLPTPIQTILSNFLVEAYAATHCDVALLVIGHSSLVIGHWSFVIGHWSFVIGHWSFVIGHSSLVIRHWSLAMLANDQ